MLAQFFLHQASLAHGHHSQSLFPWPETIKISCRFIDDRRML